MEYQLSQVEKELEHLDSENVLREYQKSLRNLPKRYSNMFYGSVGEINVVKHTGHLTRMPNHNYRIPAEKDRKPDSSSRGKWKNN